MTQPSPPTAAEMAGGGHAHTQAPLPVAVGVTANRLQSQYLGEEGDRRAADARRVLADLRRLASTRPGDDPLSIETVLLTLRPTLTDREVGHGDAPSPSERAAFHALTMFAVHMQGARSPRHRQGISFARACGMLTLKNESGSLKPRFDALLLARNARSQVIHIRSLVTLLRGADLAFDYGALARDLRSLDSPERRAGVLLRWGRDFALGTYPPSDSVS